MAMARCPTCGIKTVPWHEDLTMEHRTCDRCYEQNGMTDFDHWHTTKKTIMRHLHGKFRVTVYTK